MYSNLKDVFTKLNSSSTKYVVLRNYEDLYSSTFLANHPDIDFLCDDRKAFINILESSSRLNKNDLIHQQIIVNNVLIQIDVRTIGDGYYDTKWEKNILDNRMMYRECFYVPSKIDYFYTLLYHAIVQKWQISDDYLSRINEMKKDLEISNSLSNIELLETYMKQNNYKYSIPEFTGAIFNTKQINKKMIKLNHRRMIKRQVHALIEGLK